MMHNLEAMTTKKPIGSPVQEWFDEEEARTPGFIAAIDEANLREATAAQLKKLREDNGLTQAELAARLGVKQPVIARVESGKVMPDLRTVHRIAHALGFLVDPPTFRPMPGKKALAPRMEIIDYTRDRLAAIEQAKATLQQKRAARTGQKYRLKNRHLNRSKDA